MSVLCKSSRSAFALLATLVTAVVQPADAEASVTAATYQCQSAAGAQLHVVRLASAATAATYTPAQGEAIELAGSFSSTTHSFFADVDTYDLAAPGGTAAPLTISSHVIATRGGFPGCGRAGCDNPPAPGGGTHRSLSAVLELGDGVTLDFSCVQSAASAN